MMQNVTLNERAPVANNSLWKNLLSSFFDGKLDYRSTAESYNKKAVEFINRHLLNDETASKLWTVKSAMDPELYIFPENFDDVRKFNFLVGFDNFVVAIKQALEKTSSLKFERAERQASPPLKAYDQVGHNKELA